MLRPAARWAPAGRPDQSKSRHPESTTTRLETRGSHEREAVEEELLRLIELVFRRGGGPVAGLSRGPARRAGPRQRRVARPAGHGGGLASRSCRGPAQPWDSSRSACLLSKRPAQQRPICHGSRHPRRGSPPQRARDIEGRCAPIRNVFAANRILIAATELSATAPLKVAAREFGFRAATMPGFTEAMVPALRSTTKRFTTAART